MPHTRFLILTESSYTEVPRMRQYVANYLSRHGPTIYVKLFSVGLPHLTDVHKNLKVIDPGLYFKGVDRFYFLRLAYDLYVVTWLYILSLFYRLFLNSNLVLINFRFDLPMPYRLPRFKRKVFFINDDFISLIKQTESNFLQRKITRQHSVFNLADVIIATSPHLLPSTKRDNAVYEVIFSGHDFDKKTSSSDIAIADRNYPIKMCLMGVLNSNLALDLLEYLLLDEPSRLQLTLVGPVVSADFESFLSRHTNVIHVSPLTGNFLQKELLYHDVFLMPYSDNAINRASAVPAKLMQYLACGRPVVALNLPNLITLPNHYVSSCFDPITFKNKIFEQYWADTPNKRLERIHFSQEYTWEHQLSRLLRLIS